MHSEKRIFIRGIFFHSWKEVSLNTKAQSLLSSHFEALKSQLRRKFLFYMLILSHRCLQTRKKFVKVRHYDLTLKNERPLQPESHVNMNNVDPPLWIPGKLPSNFVYVCIWNRCLSADKFMQIISISNLGNIFILIGIYFG
jgi:hypothetical protein